MLLQKTRLCLKNVEAVYEIVVDGLSEDAIKESMRRGMHAAAEKGAHDDHCR